MERRLSDMTPGECAEVKTILSEGAMRRRLRDLGLLEGTQVECVLSAPSNDPIAYRLRSAVIAVRNEDADKIIITNPKTQSG